MKRDKAIQKIEKLLDMERTYYFTITRVKTFLDQGELEPIDNDVELVLFSDCSLDKLSEQVKTWVKVKKAGFVEDYGDENNLLLTFDTPDLTIYASVHGLDHVKNDVVIKESEREKFVKILRSK